MTAAIPGVKVPEHYAVVRCACGAAPPDEYGDGDALGWLAAHLALTYDDTEHTVLRRFQAFAEAWGKELAERNPCPQAP